VQPRVGTPIDVPVPRNVSVPCIKQHLAFGSQLSSSAAISVSKSSLDEWPADGAAVSNFRLEAIS
jgi:hypothetical protein